jgi:hypothetical protein
MAVDPVLSRGIIFWTMVCHEYIRLRQHYEAALRHWGHVLLSPVAKHIGAAARLADEVREKALVERNAANDRMRLHKQTAQSVTTVGTLNCLI